MKIKILTAVTLCVALFTACDDNDSKFNTAADVTVEMGEASMRLPEDQLSSATYYEIPINVTGEANGDIIVNVEFAPSGDNGAKYGENYVVTSNSIIIPAGNSKGAIQFYPKGDDFINDNRSFIATIKSAEGAAVSANASTLVTLIDNEGLLPKAYQKIQGLWTMSLTSVFDGDYDVDVNVIGVEEGEEGFNSILYFQNFPEQGVFAGTMSVDGVTEEISVTFDFDQVVLSGNFSFGYGITKPCYTNGSTGYYSGGGTAYCLFNAEATDGVFDFNGFPGLGFLIYQGSTPKGWWESVTKITMSR